MGDRRNSVPFQIPLLQQVRLACVTLSSASSALVFSTLPHESLVSRKLETKLSCRLRVTCGLDVIGISPKSEWNHAKGSGGSTQRPAFADLRGL